MEPLHGDVHRPRRGLANIKDPNRIRVSQSCGDLCFTVKAPHLGRTGFACREQHLDGDGLARAHVFGSVHRAETASTEDAHDPVPRRDHIPDPNRRRVDIEPLALNGRDSILGTVRAVCGGATARAVTGIRWVLANELLGKVFERMVGFQSRVF